MQAVQSTELARACEYKAGALTGGRATFAHAELEADDLANPLAELDDGPRWQLAHCT